MDAQPLASSPSSPPPFPAASSDADDVTIEDTYYPSSDSLRSYYRDKENKSLYAWPVERSSDSWLMSCFTQALLKGEFGIAGAVLDVVRYDWFFDVAFTSMPRDHRLQFLQDDCGCRELHEFFAAAIMCCVGGGNSTWMEFLCTAFGGVSTFQAEDRLPFFDRVLDWRAPHQPGLHRRVSGRTLREAMEKYRGNYKGSPRQVVGIAKFHFVLGVPYIIVDTKSGSLSGLSHWYTASSDAWLQNACGSEAIHKAAQPLMKAIADFALTPTPLYREHNLDDDESTTTVVGVKRKLAWGGGGDDVAETSDAKRSCTVSGDD